MAMSRIESGTCTLIGGQTTVAVTFANAFKAATVPLVDEKNKPRNTNVWFTNVSNTGFTLNVGASTAYNETWGYEAKGVDT